MATGALITASANADVNGFDTTNPSIPQGLVATFSNGDSITHNVTADADGPDGKALFRSGNTPGGELDRPVEGTQFLSTDDYPFRCTIHPSTMTGTLEVLNAGVPETRPAISLRIKSKKLEKVVKSGKLKVRVSAADPTRAEGVSITAKKGAKSIAKRASLNVNPGETQAVKLKLKKKAEGKLADLEKAKVRVTAEVDFGAPAKASKKLK
jgi:plastocyanin